MKKVKIWLEQEWLHPSSIKTYNTPVNTPLLVSQDLNTKPVVRYYAGENNANGFPACWPDGKTSLSMDGKQEYEIWKYATIYEGV